MVGEANEGSAATSVRGSRFDYMKHIYVSFNDHHERPFTRWVRTTALRRTPKSPPFIHVWVNCSTIPRNM